MSTSTSDNKDKLLRLKVASEIVLGNQASVAFSRAFYLEDLLIERIMKEFQELAELCQKLTDQVESFTVEVLDNGVSSNLTPLSESSVRCQCSEMLETLGTYKTSLDTFQKKLIQAKARRQAKSSLLETLSAHNSNITAEFNSMTLDQLISDVHIPEFSCFINESDFGQLEKLTDEWDQYRKSAKQDFTTFDKKINGFLQDVDNNRKMREYTCDMILTQITQQQQPHPHIYGTETLKRKGVFHKFSSLLRRHTHHASNASLNMKSQQSSPSSSKFSVATDSNNHQQTF